MWRHDPHGLKVAVVHRSRYDDWCLPKGKLENYEELEHASLREVKEETGCTATITSLAGTTQYKADDNCKIVLFYNMSVTGDCSFHPSEEVKEIEWLSLDDALERLDYPKEKELLRNAGNNLEAMNIKYDSKKSKLQYLTKDIYFNILGSNEYSRLAGDMNSYREELEKRITDSRIGQSGKDISWVPAAQKLLLDAERAMYTYDLDEAWKCFHAASRMEIFGYDESELAAISIILKQEAEKLNPWRKGSVLDLLKKISDRHSEDNNSFKPHKLHNCHQILYHAVKLRDEHYANQAYKISIRRRNMLILFFILAAINLILPVLSAFGYLPFPLDQWNILLSIELFGFLGASLSVALTITRRSIDAKVPEQVIGAFVTWMRPAIGAAAAIATYVFLRAGLLDLFSVDLSSTSAVLAIAFISGFSERLIIGTISKFQD